MSGTCCQGCQDRAVGCHSSCDRYLEYRAKQQAITDSRHEAERTRQAIIEARAPLTRRIERIKGLRP